MFELFTLQSKLFPGTADKLSYKIEESTLAPIISEQFVIWLIFLVQISQT